MTEDRSTTPLSYSERQAQLARLPASVQEALHASAKAAEHAVHEVRLKLSEVKTLLSVMLTSELGSTAVAGIDLSAALSALMRLMPSDADDALLENIGAASIEAALPALQSGQAQGQFH